MRPFLAFPVQGFSVRIAALRATEEGLGIEGRKGDREVSCPYLERELAPGSCR
jgi:hypothetical protein